MRKDAKQNVTRKKMSQNSHKILRDILWMQHFVCSTFSPFSVYVKSTKQKKISTQTEMKTYCTFSGTSTNLCSVWEYHPLPEIFLQETPSRTLNLKYLYELFICSRFYEIQCYQIVHPKKQISLQNLSG